MPLSASFAMLAVATTTHAKAAAAGDPLHDQAIGGMSATPFVPLGAMPMDAGCRTKLSLRGVTT
ncbi:hypothetical protein ASF65_06855 [Aureimonas sp. Leaf324]|jgi:hypothetical protein|nr:hypothetical protein ASF65_06855 [Aureimonas sp. Leaf324]